MKRPKSADPTKPTDRGAVERPELVADFPIALLIPNPRNPRVHPASQIERLTESLKRDGQTKPVLVRRDNNMLIAGHGVTEAARQLQWPTLSVLLWDVDQATADRVMLADNQFGALSSADKDRVGELLAEINQADYLATGFSADEAAKLLDSFNEELDIAEIETGTIRDDFYVTCRGPLPDQALVLARIKQLLGEYPAVTVELGVVPGR